MKSLAELQAIKDKMKNKVVLREGSGEIRVVVGMATCGIAAGARPVMKALMDEIEKVREELPGLDCGSCGAPNCNALAEDIVRKRAKKEDCVTILKKQYEQILFGKNKNE